MRIFLSFILIVFCCLSGQAQAWQGKSDISWQGYSLSGAQGNASADGKASSEGKTLLLALTISPRQGEYLYGAASKEGLPTTVDVTFAPLSAYPMSRPSSKEINSLLQEKGKALKVRVPAAQLKKDTPFARIILPGSGDTNPAIYPGPVTFWVEVPAASSPLGGTVIQVNMAGLLCSATSCTPTEGTLELSFAASEVTALPAAEKQPWWTAWKAGESVFIPAVQRTPGDTSSPAVDPAAFAGGKRLTPLVAEPVEDPAVALARHTAFFSTLEPTYFNPELEVQYLGEALFLGLLAGILLNLMPCVLPVVSLKFSALMAVTAMTDKAEQATAFRVHCLIFAAGIMTWFMVLAVLLGVAGWAWGELFQSPVVIVCLGLVLFLLGLSLFGVFSLPIFDLKVTSESHPHWQAFASGLLATLLATPCSGPLLGGVLGWALRQPLPVLTLCIASVGIGMSLPYGVLAFCPRLVHLLPRPGSWTIRLEQLLGFFLMGSVLYLVTLLPAEWVPAFLFNMFAVALAAWLWGQIGHLGASTLRRSIARVLAVSVVSLTLWWGSTATQVDGTWETFEPDTFAELLGKEPLLLEFTADWCPSCKALEHTTLNKKRMASLRHKYNVRTIRVDITRDAEAGKELLKALGSGSIPVLALFPKGEGAKKPVVLRDLVTPSQLKEAASDVF